MALFCAGLCAQLRAAAALACLGVLAGCGYDFNGPMCGPAPGGAFAPPSRVFAQMPRTLGGSEGYQDYGGKSYAVDGAPALNDTGSEATPRFDGNPVQEGTPPGFVIMPNGGERPVETLNALPSAPCLAMMGNG